MLIDSATRKRNTSRGQSQFRRSFLSYIPYKTAGCPHNTHKTIDCRNFADGDRKPCNQSQFVIDDLEDLVVENCIIYPGLGISYLTYPAETQSNARTLVVKFGDLSFRGRFCCTQHLPY